MQKLQELKKAYKGSKTFEMLRSRTHAVVECTYTNNDGDVSHKKFAVLYPFILVSRRDGSIREAVRAYVVEQAFADTTTNGGGNGKKSTDKADISTWLNVDAMSDVEDTGESAEFGDVLLFPAEDGRMCSKGVLLAEMLDNSEELLGTDRWDTGSHFLARYERIVVEMTIS